MDQTDWLMQNVLHRIHHLSEPALTRLSDFLPVWKQTILLLFLSIRMERIPGMINQIHNHSNCDQNRQIRQDIHE